MIGRAYTADQLAEQPAIGLFAELVYAVDPAWRQLPQGAFTGQLLTADYADYTDNNESNNFLPHPRHPRNLRFKPCLT